MTAPIVELAGVTRTYPGDVRALRPTDLAVQAGDHLAIVGPSGSGKSTLLNLLGLLDRPTTGAYRLYGEATAGLSEAARTALRGRKIGFVFQEFNLLPYRTSTENVALGLLYTGVARRERQRRARHVLTQVGLGHRLDALPTTLSGGERQRVAIARALVNDAALLLCDEPTGNLDSSTAGQVLDLLDELNRQGVTTIVITHDSATAARAKRRASIKDGVLRTDD